MKKDKLIPDVRLEGSYESTFVEHIHKAQDKANELELRLKQKKG